LASTPENIPPIAVTAMAIDATTAMCSHFTSVTANKHAAGTTVAETRDTFFYIAVTL
jgi:hypothetical protein